MSAPDLRSIATEVLGSIDWIDSDTGFCRCPGDKQHTSPTMDHDCRVKIDGAPTVYCFHTSCLNAVDDANFAMRSAAGKAAKGGKVEYKRREPTAEEKERERQRKAKEQLQARAAASLEEILKTYAMGPADFFELSPVRLAEDPAGDWRMLLQLFQPEDVVWIGSKFASCGDDEPEAKKAEYRRYFRTVTEWLREKQAPNQFTCPSIFQPDTHSRCNKAVVQRRFLVIESDTLNKDQMSAVINWCRQFMRLRAIVDTGGKSLHGWFDAPTLEQERELRVILPNLGGPPKGTWTLDPALFKIAQPCRLPGAWREVNKTRQSLLFLDLEATR